MARVPTPPPPPDKQHDQRLPTIPTTCNVKGKSWQAQVQDTRQRLHLAAAFWDEDCPVRQPSADQQHAFDLQQQWSDSQLAAQLVSCSKLKDPTVDLAKVSTRPAKCRPRTAAGRGTGPTRKSALPVSEGPTCSDNKQKQSAGTTLRHSTACLTAPPRPIKMTPSSRSIFFWQTNNRESRTAKQAHLQRQKLLVQAFLFGDRCGVVVCRRRRRAWRCQQRQARICLTADGLLGELPEIGTPCSLVACSLHVAPVRISWAERECCSGNGA